VNPLVLVVDDEPDVEVLFRQQFRRDLRTDCSAAKSICALNAPHNLPEFAAAHESGDGIRRSRAMSHVSSRCAE
jgi:hypothetical protein